MTDRLSWFPLLPHRYPFLLLDRIVEVKPGEEIIALKRVSSGEELHGSGAFPRGSLPFSLVAEAMAQAASVAVLSSSYAENPPIGFYAAIKEMRIDREAQVGEELWVRMKKVYQFGQFYEFHGEVKIGGERIGEGQLVFRLS
jgi:3-hydroxymyristoyl/3-hydroxydecanoyl-(acyl carrier protein) dehydratase